MRIEFGRNARRQIRAIFDHISVESPEAARKVLERIHAVSNTLGDHPHMGRKIGDRLRRLPITPYPYLIYYEIAGQTVRIVRVRHAARYRQAFQEPAAAFRR